MIHLDLGHTKHTKEVRIHRLVKKEPADLLQDPPECPDSMLNHHQTQQATNSHVNLLIDEISTRNIQARSKSQLPQRKNIQ